MRSNIFSRNTNVRNLAGGRQTRPLIARLLIGMARIVILISLSRQLPETYYCSVFLTRSPIIAVVGHQYVLCLIVGMG